MSRSSSRLIFIEKKEKEKKEKKRKEQEGKDSYERKITFSSFFPAPTSKRIDPSAP